MACVVVAEDNVDHQRVIAEVIRRLGHDAVITGDGRAALAAIREHRPDLVVADVDMPHMDGLQLCREIRADPMLQAVPIVLITGYFLPGDPRLDDAGARAVVSKPFTVPALSDELRRQLDNPSAHADSGFLEALLDILDTGVVACDAAGRLTTYTRPLQELYGGGEHAVPAGPWAVKLDLRLHDGTRLRDEEMPLARALAGERVRHADLLTHDLQGSPHWYTVNANPIRDPAGAITGAVAALHDVTAQYRMRQYQACKSAVLRVLAGDDDPASVGEQLLAAIGTTLGWPYLRLWLVDEVTDLLRPAASWTGGDERAPAMPAGVALGQGLAGLCWERGDLVWVPDIRAEDSPLLPQIVASTEFVAAGGVPVRSGDQVIGVLTFFMHRREDPDPALAVLLTGIAGLIGAFLEHRRAEMLTMHLAAATDEYIALVGHELRTPLTSIGAYVDLIADLPGTTPIDEIRDLFEVVRRNNHRLRDLVDKLLDLAALESGHADLKMAPVDLGALVAEVTDGKPVTADLPDHLMITGDRARLRQVVDALISNAVKFSPPEAVIAVSLRDDHGDAVVLTVADHGGGIASDEQAKLFHRLYRAGNARHTGIPGTGLGLALSRVVVERHHGTITLASREGAGTTVTVRLPKSA
ncbi:MAG: ATP-binding protein [Actinoplanes sp.]